MAQKSQPAGPQVLPAASDLLETLAHHRDGCAGMAADIIGVTKRIIAVEVEDGSYLLMFNPGDRRTAPVPIWPRRGVFLFRHPPGQTVAKHPGAVAERKISDPLQDLYRLDRPRLIQHELDHCDGILI